MPVLVLKGYNFNSRCGESIIKNANLEFLLSSNEDEYIEKAVYLSKNIEKLENERKKIYNKILNTPLFDSKKFSSNLKDELLKIYKKNTNWLFFYMKIYALFSNPKISKIVAIKVSGFETKKIIKKITIAQFFNTRAAILKKFNKLNINELIWKTKIVSTTIFWKEIFSNY